jgi:hypothetical protein
LLGAIGIEGFHFGMKVMPHARAEMTLPRMAEGKQPEGGIITIMENQVVGIGIQQVVGGQFALTRPIRRHVGLYDPGIEDIVKAGET